ncbi:unnamed protein product [Polarella glacialis]|uniref:Uncharacterized protein n=1 Tax=Polarella glacialis TaxID=89957 RepID=A0A813LXN9_POLGL|nr:unnamed protein product [Polarella glacialis]
MFGALRAVVARLFSLGFGAAAAAAETEPVKAQAQIQQEAKEAGNAARNGSGTARRGLTEASAADPSADAESGAAGNVSHALPPEEDPDKMEKLKVLEAENKEEQCRRPLAAESSASKPARHASQAASSSEAPRGEAELEPQKQNPKKLQTPSQSEVTSQLPASPEFASAQPGIASSATASADCRSQLKMPPRSELEQLLRAKRAKLYASGELPAPVIGVSQVSAPVIGVAQVSAPVIGVAHDADADGRGESGSSAAAEPASEVPATSGKVLRLPPRSELERLLREKRAELATTATAPVEVSSKSLDTATVSSSHAVAQAEPPARILLGKPAAPAVQDGSPAADAAKDREKKLRMALVDKRLETLRSLVTEKAAELDKLREHHTKGERFEAPSRLETLRSLVTEKTAELDKLRERHTKGERFETPSPKVSATKSSQASAAVHVASPLKAQVSATTATAQHATPAAAAAAASVTASSVGNFAAADPKTAAEKTFVISAAEQKPHQVAPTERPAAASPTSASHLLSPAAVKGAVAKAGIAAKPVLKRQTSAVPVAGAPPATSPRPDDNQHPQMLDLRHVSPTSASKGLGKRLRLGSQLPTVLRSEPLPSSGETGAETGDVSSGSGSVAKAARLQSSGTGGFTVFPVSNSIDRSRRRDDSSGSDHGNRSCSLSPSSRSVSTCGQSAGSPDSHHRRSQGSERKPPVTLQPRDGSRLHSPSSQGLKRKPPVTLQPRGSPTPWHNQERSPAVTRDRDAGNEPDAATPSSTALPGRALKKHRAAAAAPAAAAASDVTPPSGRSAPGAVMDVSSGSEAEDFGVVDCSFVGENGEAEKLRQRIRQTEEKMLKRARKEEQKARKSAMKAAEKALKAVKLAELAEAEAEAARTKASPYKASAASLARTADPSWRKLEEFCSQESGAQGGRA